MIDRRAIIASYQAFEHVKKALPKRTVLAATWAPNDWFYWFGNKGAVRMMKIDDPKVWVLDYGRGFPYIKVRKILK